MNQRIKKASRHTIQSEGLIFEKSSPGKRAFELPPLDVPAVDPVKALGAHPFLLLSTRPFTDADAGDWWREAALYTDFVREVYFAFVQVSRAGSEEQIAKAKEVLDDARRRLYLILAAGEAGEGEVRDV